MTSLSTLPDFVCNAYLYELVYDEFLDYLAERDTLHQL